MGFQEMRRPLAHSMSLPVGGVRRKMLEEDSRRVRGRHSVPGANNVNQPSHHPSQPLPQNSKQKLQRSNAAQTGPVRSTRTFAFDDGQLSINSSESEVSEHIYEEIKDQSSSEEEPPQALWLFGLGLQACWPLDVCFCLKSEKMKSCWNSLLTPRLKQ